MHDRELMRRLGKLLGRRCRHRGRECTLVDILEQEGALVLRWEDDLPPVQGDQFGQPLRRAMETHLVPILDPDTAGLTAELSDLLADLQHRAA